MSSKNKFGIEMNTICILLFFLVSSVPNIICNVESNGNEDYFESGAAKSLERTGSGPSLLSPDSQQQIKGFEPIYISPDLEDIMDQQQYNVYHEEVHGTILMPRISFGLNDDDQPIKDEDYGDYVNLINGVDPKHYGRRKGRRGGMAGGGGGGGGMGGSGGKGGGVITGGAGNVKVFGNPMYNPTIEEMIPFSRIKDSKDTYIVMADDPVLAVDSVPKCQGDSGSDEGGDEGGGEGGEEGSTEGGDGASTEGGEERRRRKRSLLY